MKFNRLVFLRNLDSFRFCKPFLTGRKWKSLLILYSILSFSNFSYAQNYALQDIEKDLYKAEGLLRSFKNDSALLYIEKLQAGLKTVNPSNGYWSLRVRLAEAMALDQKSQELVATQRLIKIIDESNKKSTCDIYVKANLLMALIHEKEGIKENSLKYLNQAKKTIDTYGLDSLYVNYAIRMASWKRYYESVDSAVPYAKEVLELAPRYSLRLEEAVGHMLLQSLLRSKVPNESLRHTLKALEIYKELGDFLGQSYMYNSAARSYLESGNYAKAKMYNDSSVVAIKSGLNDKDSERTHLGIVYILRGQVFEGLGRADSAFFYTSLGYKMELEREKRRFSNKITELEILNKSEKKEQKYLQELKRRNIILITTLLILVLAIGLVYLGYYAYKKQKGYAIKLSKKNRLISEQTEHLKRLDESKSMFFANASHELRTPLTLILGPIDTLLKDENLSLQQKSQLLSIAHQGGVTLKNLISQILDLSKLDGGNMKLYLKPTRVHAFFETWFVQFESLTHTKRLEYITENQIPKNLLAILDQEKCRQIISNLISNALKFTEKDGKVQVIVKYEENRLKLCVTDTGRGIDPSDLPYIFDRYFQASNRDEIAQGGLGIGLALCRDYVILMGGDIKVESTLGKGSSFLVEFPLEITTEKPEEEIIKEETIFKLEEKQDIIKVRKSTVLVVEDNLTLQNYLHLLLSDKYNVLIADHGEAALNFLNEIKDVDIIISDLMMPVMDGYRLLDSLKSNKATEKIPVIMLTARAEKDAKLKALQMGVDDYMTKPFNEDELHVRISNLLKNYEVRKKALEEVNEIGVADDEHSEDDKEWLSNFEGYIKNIYLDSQISIPDIASDFAMSESGLLRRLKRLIGLSPQQYIQELRLQEAMALLGESSNNYTVQQIALKTGYKDSRTFSRAFKNRFGKLPSTVISA